MNIKKNISLIYDQKNSGSESSGQKKKKTLGSEVYQSFVWIALKTGEVCNWTFFFGSHVLFIEPVSTKFNKFCFKIRSCGTVHTFKNYFTLIFLTINF